MPIPLLPTSPGTTPARRSLQNTRRLLAQELHSLTLVSTTADGATNGTTVVATRLANALDASRYRGAWIMPTDGSYAGQVRRVRVDDALNTTTGGLAVGPAFDGQIMSGTTIEVHRLLPPDDDDGWTGLRACITAALAECWVPRRLAVTGVASQLEYTMATYADVLDPDAIHELYGPGSSGAHPEPFGGWEAVQSGEAINVKITPTLASGDAALLGVTVPGDTYLRMAGTWQQVNTGGLVNDADEHLFDPGFVVQVALAHAYQSLANGPDGDRYNALASKQRRKVNMLKLAQLPHPQERVNHGIRQRTSFGSKDWRSW